MPPAQFIGSISDPRDVSLALRLFKDYQTPEMQKLYLFTQESKPHLRASPTYLADVQARGGFPARDTISVGHRRTLVDWLHELSQHFYPKSSLSETFQLAVNFLDRASALRPMMLPEYQRLGGACFLIASKVVETHPPSCRDLSELSGGAFTPRLLQAMELWVISGLKWNLNPPTPHMFLDPFISLFPFNEHDYMNIYHLANQYLDCIQREYAFLRYRPSVQALAALQCAFARRGIPNFHSYVSTELARIAEGPTVMISSLSIPRMRDIEELAATITSRLSNKPPSARRTSQQVTHSTQVQHGLATPVVSAQNSCSTGTQRNSIQAQVDSFFGNKRVQQTQQEPVVAKANVKERSSIAATAGGVPAGGPVADPRQLPPQQRQHPQHHQQQHQQQRQPKPHQQQLQQQQQQQQHQQQQQQQQAHFSAQPVAVLPSDYLPFPPVRGLPVLAYQQALAFLERPPALRGEECAQLYEALNFAMQYDVSEAMKKKMLHAQRWLISLAEVQSREHRIEPRVQPVEGNVHEHLRQELQQQVQQAKVQEPKPQPQRQQKQKRPPARKSAAPALAPAAVAAAQSTILQPSAPAPAPALASQQQRQQQRQQQQLPPAAVAAPRFTRAALRQQQLQQQQQNQPLPLTTYNGISKSGRKRAAGGPPPAQEQIRKRAATATFPTPDEQPSQPLPSMAAKAGKVA
ncbi:hypothetical protein HDU86_005549 [Geranomyces michiganensis]|nr:hypothetical protein HDU86_005549 [Geranomyces michiganensis]